jgi:hypothetical protein
VSAWTSAPAVADWGRFAAPRFRWYHLLALSQSIVDVGVDAAGLAVNVVQAVSESS